MYDHCQYRQLNQEKVTDMIKEIMDTIKKKINKIINNKSLKYYAALTANKIEIIKNNLETHVFAYPLNRFSSN